MNNLHVDVSPSVDILKLYSPVCSVTDELDGLEVCFSWWLHCSNLALKIKGHNASVIYSMMVCDIMHASMFLHA